MSNKDKQDREQLIEELVNLKAGKVSAGICGREYCERCGELGSFSGFTGALGSHLDYSRFTCWQCRAEGSGPGLDQLILERGFRYCGGPKLRLRRSSTIRRTPRCRNARW